MIRRLAAVAAVSILLAAPALSHETPAAPAETPPKVAPFRAELAAGALRVKLVDHSPRFLAWYEAAAAAPDATARFDLWSRMYGVAAVPPGPEGQALARRLADEAWPRYAQVLPVARAGAAGLKAEFAQILGRVAETLGYAGAGPVEVVTFIGAFDANAYTYRGEAPTVVLPLEGGADDRRRMLAHEGAHAVHILAADLSGGWERSIAATLLQEGLAMHVAREVVPGAPLEAYVEHTPGWLAAARGRQRAILEGLAPHLEAKDGQTVLRFTMGEGATGLEREAYFAGWVVVEQLRAEGMSLAQIARVPEAEMPALVRPVIERLVAAAD